MSVWTDLGGGVHVRRSRCYEMNSVVLVRDAHAVVIDPGVLPTEMTELAAFTAERAPRYEQVALAFTHPHWDHVLGKPWFPAATTYAHVGFADEAERDEAEIESKAKAWIESEGEAWPVPFRAFTPDLTVRGTINVRMGPFEAVSYDVPGHNASEIALWFPHEGVLVAGDRLSDIEIPWLAGPPWVYRRSLKSLHYLMEHEDVRTLVPGHGPIAHGRVTAYKRLLRDMDYLLHLEERVGAAHDRGASLEEAQAELAAMEYLGKDSAYPMNDVHRENVAFAWKGLTEDFDESPA